MFIQCKEALINLSDNSHNIEEMKNYVIASKNLLIVESEPEQT